MRLYDLHWYLVLSRMYRLPIGKKRACNAVSGHNSNVG